MGENTTARLKPTATLADIFQSLRKVTGGRGRVGGKSCRANMFEKNQHGLNDKKNIPIYVK